MGGLEIPPEGPVIRHLCQEGYSWARHLMNSPLIRQLQKEGSWIGAEFDSDDSNRLWHPRIFFPSYSHEWTPGMLQRAGALTLRIQGLLLHEGLELKDATPSNVLFDGTQPVFVDFLSPTLRPSGQMGWRAYGQFTRTFLIPLYLHRHRGLPLAWAGLARRDGIPPENALPLLGLIGRFHPSALSLITLPVWLGRRAAKSVQKIARAEEDQLALTTTHQIMKGLSRQLDHFAPTASSVSHWSDYQDQGVSYTSGELASKAAFVQSALDRKKPSKVLDLGCNTGHFSRMAARSGARVVALDADPVCVERVFLESERDQLDILPLVADLGRPTPDLGWERADGLSLATRLRGRFDMVLALALLHHLLVIERLPLERFLSMLAQWTTRWVLLEWVPPTDPQFQRLAGANLDLYSKLTLATFENLVQTRFDIIESTRLSEEGRILFLLKLNQPISSAASS